MSEPTPETPKPDERPPRENRAAVTRAEHHAREAGPEVLTDEEKARLAEEASRIEDA